MRIYDISMAIHPEMTVWKDRAEKKPEFVITRDFENGQGGRETKISIDLHTGTHIDAPLHFIEDGNTIEHTKIEQLVRPVKVFDLSHLEERITRKDLVGLDIQANDFILLKTRNSAIEEFDLNFVFVDRTGAEYLIEKRIAGVGIDSLGIERDQTDHATHKGLLSNNIIIIEGLRLAAVSPGEYIMVAAPLKLVNVEAAPARIILLDCNDNVLTKDC